MMVKTPYKIVAGAVVSSAEEAQPTQSFVIDVRGMKCAGCVRAVEKQLTACEGVISATVNLVTEVAVVETATGLEVNPSTLTERLTECGFPSQLRTGEERDRTPHTRLADWLTA